ncbi:MAG: class II aldolase/adducin family protein [Deltaproteobacteria bacterium]|nr:MAG: class II aldolase/adducin family protein [Deltaproteobacteria bacterium]
MRSRIVQIARLLHHRGMLAGMDGNLSTRTPRGYLVTRTSCAKGLLVESDVVEVDAEGHPVDSSGPRPTSELALHLACYRARPDVGAVVHAHPPHAVARTLVGRDLAVDVLPEALLILGDVPVVPYARTGSIDLAAAVGDAIASASAVLLERHGAVAVGADLDQALIRLETLEHTARILGIAEGMGDLVPLPEAQLDELRAYREILGA